MIRRRELLAGSAAMTMTASAANQGRIDCQSHLFSEEFLTLLEKRKESPYVYRKGDDRFVVVGRWTRRLMPAILTCGRRSLTWTKPESISRRSASTIPAPNCLAGIRLQWRAC